MDLKFVIVPSTEEEQKLFDERDSGKITEEEFTEKMKERGHDPEVCVFATKEERKMIEEKSGKKTLLKSKIENSQKKNMTKTMQRRGVSR